MTTGEMSFRKVFSERLLILMDHKNVSEFARFCGIPQATMDRYVKCKRTPMGDSLAQIIKATGVNSDWLLGLTDHRALATPAPAPFFNVKGLHAAEAPPGCPNCARLNATVDTLLERLKEHAVEAGRSRPARKKPSSEPVKSSLYPA